MRHSRIRLPYIAAIDLFVVPTIKFKLLERRRPIWTNVTVHPAAKWLAQRITEAFPGDQAPRYPVSLLGFSAVVRDTVRFLSVVATAYSPVMRYKPSYTALACTLLVAACAQTPMGPTVQVLPGPNKTFSSFQNDQAVCRQFAQQVVTDQAQGANLRGFGTAALTTALGAGLGAAIGGGSGAGIGAAAGAVGGAGLGAMRTSNAQSSIQAQYDNAFVQCMFGLGNSVPNTGPMMVRPQAPGRS